MSSRRIAIIAFEGWNDAGEAASSALDHLINVFNGEKIYSFDPEPFYDFQVNRPLIRNSDTGEKIIEWRTTSIYKASRMNDIDIFLVRGIEPSMQWRNFTATVIDQFESLKIDLVVSLGALLSDTPHSRPIPITPVALTKDIASQFEIELSDYEGPTGILGVIQEGLVKTDILGISLWAAVPHYVSQPPSPKATMALIDALENLIDIPIPLDDLQTKVNVWINQVNNLVNSDEEMLEYVKKLEEEGDALDFPMDTGETIAREFERYLKRRGSN